MFLIFLTLFLLSLSWFPLTGFYEPTNIHNNPPVWFSFISIALAIICLLFSKKQININFKRKRSLLFIMLPSIVFILLIPFPYNLPAILIAFSSILLSAQFLFSENQVSKALNRILVSIFVVGLILAFQTMILPFFIFFSSHFHSVDISAPFISLIMNIFGASTSYESGNLFVLYADKVYSFIPSWDAFGLYPLLNILIGGYFLFFLFSSTKRYYLYLPIILFLYMFIRYILMLCMFLELEQVNVFWRLDILVISLIPLFSLLPLILKNAFGSKYSNSTPILSTLILTSTFKSKYLMLSISFAISIICWSLFFGFVDPGERKQGRILIDEKHSDWEWSTQEFNTRWYGEKSTYNYYSLAEYLKYYYKVDQKFEELTEDLLKNYDILFIKTPTEPFSEREIGSIRAFVENGGSLLLIGDHTNVFGITTNLNPLSLQFGIKFRYDGQYDLEGELSLYEKPKVLQHPVNQWMPKFMFATGCTIDAPLLAENVIIGYGIKSIYLDYGQKNFFPKNAGVNENMEFGLFVQAAGVTYGRGRVFLFTDSTVWSNFYMFIPGKPELLLGIIEWLNRSNGILNILRLISLFLGLISLIITTFISIKISKTSERSSILLTLLFTGFLIAPLSITGINYLNRTRYPIPEPHNKYTKINFEIEHSNFELPIYHVTQDVQRSYHTFFVSLQRLGFVPSVKNKYLEAIKDADALVLINPIKPFDDEELKKTKDFVSRGGRLFLIDDPGVNKYKISNQLTSKFGIQLLAVDSLNTPIKVMRPENDTSVISTSSSGEIIGGLPMAYAKFRVLDKKQTPYSDRIIHQDQYQLRQLPARIPPLLKDSLNLKGKILKNMQMDQNPLSLQMSIDTTKQWPILSIQKEGKGVVVVMSSSFLFTDKEMGFSGTIPNQNMKRIYELVYWIFGDVLKMGRIKNESGL